MTELHIDRQGGRKVAGTPRDGTLEYRLRALVRTRAIISARAGLGRLERATTPGPDPAGDPSASNLRNPST